MRIISFGDKIKEKQPAHVKHVGLVLRLFTTWRMPRRDRDWEAGEVVKVVYKNRSPQHRRELGTAVIISKVPRSLTSGWGRVTSGYGISHEEAQLDGFRNAHETHVFLQKSHGERYWEEDINILLLCWIEIDDDAYAEVVAGCG